MGRFVQLFSQTIDLKIFQSCLWWKKSQVKTISGLDAWLSYIRWYYASNGPALVCCSLVSWVIIFSLIFSSGKIIILLYHLKDLGLFIVCEHQFMIDGMSFHILAFIVSGSRFSGRPVRWAVLRSFVWQTMMPLASIWITHWQNTSWLI